VNLAVVLTYLNNKGRYTDCHVCDIVMLSVVMLSVIMLNVGVPKQVVEQSTNNPEIWGTNPAPATWHFFSLCFSLSRIWVYLNFEFT